MTLPGSETIAAREAAPYASFYHMHGQDLTRPPIGGEERAMSKPQPPQSQPQSVSVRFDYHSAYNEIVNPKHFVSDTLYYVKNWLPKLGGNGHLIVTVLRSYGFYDGAHGKHRDGIDIDQRKLAEECGLSLSTLQREFVKNAVLARFVQREFVVERDRAGRILQEHYIYRVKMDDPLTLEDQARFDALVAGPDKPNGPNDKPNGSDNPIGHSDVSDHSPMRQNDVSALQNDTPIGQIDVPVGQIDAPYKGDSSTLTTKDTLTTPAAPGDSLSLFQEGQTPVPTWSEMAEGERRPYLERAKTELHKYAMQAGAERWARIGPRQEQVRAQHIYETEKKGQTWTGTIIR